MPPGTRRIDAQPVVKDYGRMRAKRLTLYFLIAFSAALFALCFLAPYYAALSFRFLKGYYDVHIMYGSTAGKVLWNFTFLIAGLALMCLGAKYCRPAPRAGVIAFLLISATVTLVWYFAFSIVADVFQRYQVPATAGSHFQFCQDGSYYHEVVSHEHPHTLKAVAHKLLFSNHNFITGEAFARLFEYSITYPVILLSILLLCFIVSLPFLSGLSLVDSLFYIWGFYAVFFSCFDGGVLAGSTGLAFMALPFIGGKNSPPVRAILQLLVMGASALGGVALIFGFYFIKGNHFEPAPTLQSINFFTSGVSLSRIMVFALLAAFQTGSRRKLDAAPWLLLFAFLYPHCAGNWRVEAFKNNLPVKANEELVLHLYTDRPVEFGRPLLKARNFTSIAYTPAEDSSSWELCQKLLHDVEGISYKSIMVSVYCTVTRLPQSKTEDAAGTAFLIIEKGECGFYCSPELSNIYKFRQSGRMHFFDWRDDRVRDHGATMCLAGAKKVLSFPANWSSDTAERSVGYSQLE